MSMTGKSDRHAFLRRRVAGLSEIFTMRPVGLEVNCRETSKNKQLGLSCVCGTLLASLLGGMLRFASENEMKRLLRLAGLVVGCVAGAGASAGQVDLTAGGSGSLSNEYVAGVPGTAAVYSSLATSIVGTGYIDPFLRINPGGGLTPEQGYNNDWKSNQQQYYEDASWTRGFLLTDVPVVNVGGIQYREFLLDINQANNKAGAQYLSLDAVRIWFGAQPTYSPTGAYKPNKDGGWDYDGKFNTTSPGMTLAYSMDTSNSTKDKNGNPLGDNQVLLDYTVCEKNPSCFGAKGSGNNFDMRLLVPNTAFAGALPGAFVTFFSSFGYIDGQNRLTADGNISTWAQTDGFEEWTFRSTTCTGPNCEPFGGIPEPGTLALLGATLAGLALRRRGKFSSAA